MFRRAVTLVRIGDIPVRVHPSWLLVAVVVVWSLTTQFRSMAVGWQAFGLATVTAIGFFGSILVHELAHAVQARALGIRVHAVTLFVFGGVTEMEDAAHRPRDEFLVAAIGPWASLTLAATFGLATTALDLFGLVPAVARITGLLGWLNLTLAVFNLIPGAPLDGGRVLMAAVWKLLGDRVRASRWAAGLGVLVGLCLWGLAALLVIWDANALLSTLWLTVVAAFMVVIAVNQWQRAPERASVPEFPPPEPTAARALDQPVLDSELSLGPLILFGLSCLVVVLGFVLVPMPLIEMSPGPTFEVEELIEVAGDTTPVNGDVVMLTAFLRQPGMAEVLRAAVVPERDLIARERVIPSDQRTTDYFAQQREVYLGVFDQAVAAGLIAAGEDVVATTRVLVGQVLSDGPATEVLQPGDTLVMAGGRPITSGEQLAASTASLPDGTELALTVRRDGQLLDLSVTVGPLPGVQRSGIGITVGTETGQLRLPREVNHSDLQVGGPSAGLSTALAVYDLVSQDDLLAGQRVAATGTMSIDGQVGRIGAIPQKVHAAIAAQVDVMLVPRSQTNEALAVADGRLRIVGVTSLDEAIATLH